MQYLDHIILLVPYSEAEGQSRYKSTEIVIQRPQVQSMTSLHVARFVLSSLQFNASVAPLNNQLAGGKPVGILNLVNHNKNYWFISNSILPPINSFFCAIFSELLLLF